MGVMGIILIPLCVTIIGGLILFFLTPIFNKPRDKFYKWIQKKFTKKKKPIVQSRTSSHPLDSKRKDIELLEEILSLLQFINYLPNDPDRIIKSIPDKLFEIQEKARNIRTNDFDEIKNKLIQYGEKVNNIHGNIRLVELQKLLIRGNQTSNLIDEIKDILDAKIKVNNESLA